MMPTDDTSMFRRKEKPLQGDGIKPPLPPKRNVFAFLQKDKGDKGSIEDSVRHHSEAIVQSPISSGNGHHHEPFKPETSYIPQTRPMAFSLEEKQDNGSQSISRVSMKSPRLIGSPKDFNISGLSLPALAPVQVQVRKLVLQRNLTGDFGFSIRRVQLPAGNRGELRSVVFAEPTEIRAGPPRPDDLKHGLLPGDELMSIDGRRVESLTREELQEAVRNAKESIELVVRPVPELAEFCDRRRGVRDTGDQWLLPHIDTNVHQEIPEEQRYWLFHKGGYTAVRLASVLEDGRCRIMVANREMTVDPTDIDRANPSRLDRVADLSNLHYLNATSAIHLLRQRFGSSLQYTNAGSQSVVHMASLEEEGGVQERLVSLFKGCRRGQMPAHIYATAQQVYRNVQMTGANQSIVLTGVSGSGKSTQMRYLIHYMASVAGWTNSLTYERLSMVLGVVQAFGHAATQMHNDATRCALLFALGFDKAAALRCARVQLTLLESDRVVRRAEGESSFHVFYYMMEGVTGAQRERLGLDKIDSNTLVRLRKVEEREKAAEAWGLLVYALGTLGLDDSRMDAVCSVLAAILHLNAAGSTPGNAHRAHFVRASHAQVAAELLGCSPDDLAQAVFRGKTAALANTAFSAQAINRVSFTSRGPDGEDALAAFASTLYSELVASLIEILNKNLTTPAANSWIAVLDYPGSTFHTDWVDGVRRKTQNLNDLVHNYFNERIAELFFDMSFKDPQEVYKREQVDVEVDEPLHSPHELNRLLDQKQQLLSCTDVERRSTERRGLLAILEEEALFPGATDESLLERFFVHLGDQTKLIHRGSSTKHFVLEHGMGAQPAAYDVTGWVRQAQPCESAAAARPLLASSKRVPISSLFALAVGGDSAKMRRATQIAHLELSARRAAAGFLANIEANIDYVLSGVRRSGRSSFVHCVQPTAGMRSASDLDVPFVRSQLSSLLLIDAVRANNRGYPERVPFRDFRRRFGCLAEESETIENALDDRAAVARILERMDVHQHRYRLGISQILLSSDVLPELEDRRELALSGTVVAFQRECRRALANKWLERRRVLETAIRCIQKNGRSYMKVREWSWWRLYTRVAPLLPLNRVEGEQREWQERVAALENQLEQIRLHKTRIEAKNADLEEELGRESQSAAELSVALDRETQARMQLERRLANAGGDADNISRVSSTVLLESAVTEQASELKSELVRVKDEEEKLRVKTQRTVAQLQDVEAELSRVKARNETLEKKQQRFDGDVQSVEQQLMEVKGAKERAEKERDEHHMASTRKGTELQSLKTENTELRTVVSRLKREADERIPGAAGQEADLAILQKTKRELEAKCRDQEEEMDDMAGQNQKLQQQVTRLEMASERLKNDLQREQSAREAETEEVRGQFQRRLRALEDQLADQHDNNQTLVKENRLLEARARQSTINTQGFEESGDFYRRELRKALALLHDAQTSLAHEREAAPSQSLIRQLREQVEDAEAAKTAALKSRHNLESELNEVRVQLGQAMVMKSLAEDKALALMKEKSGAFALCEEKDEQLQSVLKKYKSALQQNHIDHIAIADQLEQIADLQKARQKTLDNLNEASSQLEFLHQHTVEKHKLMLCEKKQRDTEAKLELESAHRIRLEAMVARLSDEIEGMQEQASESSHAKEKELEAARKIRKDMMQLQETIEEHRKRDLDSASKNKAARNDVERLEEQVKALQTELKTCHRRIQSLQAALSEGLGEDESDEDGEPLDSTGMNIL